MTKQIEKPLTVEEIKGAELRRLRKANEWDQSDLAKKADTTRETISRWENGAWPDSLKEKSLARLFGKSEDHFNEIVRRTFPDYGASADTTGQSDHDDAERLAQLLRYFAYFRNLGGKKWDHLVRQISIFGEDIERLHPELTSGELTMESFKDIMAALERAISDLEKRTDTEMD